MTYLNQRRAGAIFAGVLALCSLPLPGQDARTLRAQAEAESNQEKQVILLCKAADLDPKNKEYRRDCDVSKSALISSDRQALKTAQDALDDGNLTKAKRYAKYVSSLDPDLHRQAEQLLQAKAAEAKNPENGGTPAGAPNKDDANKAAQSALLAQASAAFQSGNLQAAKSAAQGVTDASLKPQAGQILAEIEKYSGLVNEGQHHEAAKEYAAAERSYKGAQSVNAHVASDDLAGRIARMDQAAAPVVVGKQDKPKVLPPDKPKPTVEVSLDDKKKHLLDEGSAAMARNEVSTAGKYFNQVLTLDPGNAAAKQGLAEITVALNKDPERLERTLREAIRFFYASQFDDAESRFNQYLGADGGKKKGAAYFYLGATEATLALLEEPGKKAARTRKAQENFKQARVAGYQPIDKYVSSRVLGLWASSSM